MWQSVYTTFKWKDAHTHTHTYLTFNNISELSYCCNFVPNWWMEFFRYIVYGLIFSFFFPLADLPAMIVTSEPCRFALTYGEWDVSLAPARWTGGDGLTLLRVAIILEASSRRRNRKRLVRLRDRRHRWPYTGPAADRPVRAKYAIAYTRTLGRTHYR